MFVPCGGVLCAGMHRVGVQLIGLPSVSERGGGICITQLPLVVLSLNV